MSSVPFSSNVCCFDTRTYSGVVTGSIVGLMHT
jgi:hypothetical protein